MLELLKVDLYKLTKSSLVKIVFFISVLSAALMYLLSHLLATGELPIQNTGILSLFADSQMFILLGCVFIWIFLCSDFEYKVIENAVLAGHSRSSIVTSKMISLVIFVSLLTVPYFAVILFSTAARFELHVYLPSAYLMITKLATTDPDIIPIALFVILAILTYSAQLSIGIFFLFLFKRPVVVLAVSYLSNLLLGPVLGLTDTTKQIMEYTPFGVNFAGMTTHFEFPVFIRSCLSGFLFLLVFTFLSILVFRKSEIK